MDRAQGHSRLPSPLCEVEDYYSSDSFSPSLKQAFQSKTKVESSKTVVMPVRTTGRNNLEEEMVVMKAMLERLVKEKKDVRIKLQEEIIVRLTKQLEKRPSRSLPKSLESEEERTSSKVKLPTRRSTQRRAINSKMAGLQA